MSVLYLHSARSSLSLTCETASCPRGTRDQNSQLCCYKHTSYSIYVGINKCRGYDPHKTTRAAAAGGVSQKRAKSGGYCETVRAWTGTGRHFPTSACVYQSINFAAPAREGNFNKPPQKEEHPLQLLLLLSAASSEDRIRDGGRI